MVISQQETPATPIQLMKLGLKEGEKTEKKKKKINTNSISCVCRLHIKGNGVRGGAEVEGQET